MGSQLIDRGLGDGRCCWHERRGPVGGHGSCIGNLGVPDLSAEAPLPVRRSAVGPRIQNLLFTQRRFILRWRHNRLLRGMMMGLLFRRNIRLIGLEPAFPMTVETINPVLTWRRLAGLQQAFLLRGGRRGGFFG